MINVRRRRKLNLGLPFKLWRNLFGQSDMVLTFFSSSCRNARSKRGDCLCQNQRRCKPPMRSRSAGVSSDLLASLLFRGEKEPNKRGDFTQRRGRIDPPLSAADLL